MWDEKYIFLWTYAVLLFLIHFFRFFASPILCGIVCFSPFANASHSLHLMPIFWTKLIELSFLNCVWTCTFWLHSTQCLHLWTKFITIALLLFANYLNCITNSSIHPFISFINACFLEGAIFFSKHLFHEILRKTLIKGT